MINQKDVFWWYKINAILRIIIVRNNNFIFKQNLIVNEYPKSGASWISQMLSEVYDLPFPRNRLPVMGKSIIHGHYFSSLGINNCLVVFRDGRDVLISQYYHWTHFNDRLNSSLVDKTRNYLKFQDYENIYENLPAFINYVYLNKRHPRYTWSEFANKWASSNYLIVKYEDMLTNPVQELNKISKRLYGIEPNHKLLKSVVERYSFEKLSGRKQGEENKNSFLRKGIIGDWKNHFSDESKELFKKFAGKELIQLGYEKDLNW